MFGRRNDAGFWCNLGVYVEDYHLFEKLVFDSRQETGLKLEDRGRLR